MCLSSQSAENTEAKEPSVQLSASASLHSPDPHGKCWTDFFPFLFLAKHSVSCQGGANAASKRKSLCVLAPLTSQLDSKTN